jgi:hypothetical protein
MKFIRNGVVCAFGVSFCLAVGAQPYPLELIRHREDCKSLPTHAAVQECQAHQRAEYKDWQKQSNDRYETPPLRLNGEASKPPMNCFKREATGEQVCAN